PCFSNRAGSTRRASLPSSSSPSESASRFAGSIVSTQTFSPRIAIPVAIAAEVVVLPTPPEPAQMQISFPVRISPRFAISPTASSAEPPRQGSRALAPELRLEQEGQRFHRRLDPAPQPRQLRPLAA